MSFVDRLICHANIGAWNCERYRGLWHPIEVSHIYFEVVDLTYKAVSDLPPRQNLTVSQLLDVFFEPPVAQLMMQLPNSYWFHSVFELSVLLHAMAGHYLATERRNRIGLSAYKSAIECLRQAASTGCERFDLSLRLDQLSPVQVAARTRYGIIVLRMKGSGLDADGELLVNPIFEPIFKID